MASAAFGAVKRVWVAMCLFLPYKSILEIRYGKTERPKMPQGTGNFGVRECPVCGIEFTAHRSNQIVCGKKCKTVRHAQNLHLSNENLKNLYRESRKSIIVRCRGCGIENPVRSKRYCTDECRIRAETERKSVKTKSKSRRVWIDTIGTCHSRLPFGYYVYGWFELEEPNPFYIGKGTEGRIFDRHSDKAESKRRVDIRYVVFVESLMESESFLVERVLIDVYRLQGAILENQ